jgi:hypothetical protein
MLGNAFHKRSHMHRYFLQQGIGGQDSRILDDLNLTILSVMFPNRPDFDNLKLMSS